MSAIGPLPRDPGNDSILRRTLSAGIVAIAESVTEIVDEGGDRWTP
jgi:hypothetical protein